MNLGKTKYDIGDEVLVEGSYLEIERALTIIEIQMRTKRHNEVNIWYGFKETLWMHLESDILKKVELK